MVMDTLLVLSGMLALVAMPICLVVIVIQAIRRKSKKKWTIAMVGSFAVFIISIALTITSVCDHIWEDANCEDAKTCSLCGEHSGEALGHDLRDYRIVREATCAEVGHKEGGCVRCGNVITEEIPRTAHQMMEQIVLEEATCTENGKIEKKCQNCEYTELETVAPMGHTDGEWIVVEEATYYQTGNRSIYCERCNEMIRTEAYELSEVEKEIAFLAMCEPANYESLARYPEKYIDKPITFEGEVIQVVEEDNEYTLRVDITWNGYFYEDTVWVEYAKKDSDDGRILEGDKITVYGIGMDMKNYTSVLFTTITIPAVSAMYVYY